MQTVTLDNALDMVEALPLEQQETLFDIWQKRKIQARREEITRNIEEARAMSARGELKSMTLEEALKDLNE